MTSWQMQAVQEEGYQTYGWNAFANTKNKKVKTFCWKCFGYSVIGCAMLGIGYILVFTAIAYAIP